MNAFERIEFGATGRKNDGSWIGTYTGGAAWPNDPRPYDFNIIDIAHSLALSCRWTGHIYTHYSVAEHSVRVAELLKAHGKSRKTQLKGLLHDGSEAYISDIARPSKRQMPEYAKIETGIMNVLWNSFGLGVTYEHGDGIKDADDALLYAEARDLMPPAPMPWTSVFPPGEMRYTKRIRPWSPLKAEYRFIKLYADLADDPYIMREWYAQKWKAFKYFKLGIGLPDPQGDKKVNTMKGWI